jgi:hypothetical protein
MKKKKTPLEMILPGIHPLGYWIWWTGAASMWVTEDYDPLNNFECPSVRINAWHPAWLILLIVWIPICLFTEACLQEFIEQFRRSKVQSVKFRRRDYLRLKKQYLAQS